MAYTLRSDRSARKGVKVRLLSSAPMKLWIDDVRPAPNGWKHVKTASEAISCIESENTITHISFDHDLGEGNGSGYEVVCVVEERIYNGMMKMPEMCVHSANPVGATRIQQAIDTIKRHGGLQESG